MSVINDIPDRLPSQIINHITSIRNYLKKRNLKSIQIEEGRRFLCKHKTRLFKRYK